MALIEKLEKLKKLSDQYEEKDWLMYKKIWKESVSKLEKTITSKWFNDYKVKGLMTFETFPVKRIESFIGEYLTSILEITISENKFLVLEPVSTVTAEYDGKLEFYMRGNIYNKVSILRKLINNQEPEWLIAKSYNQNEYQKLNKPQLEKLIEEWLQ